MTRLRVPQPLAFNVQRPDDLPGPVVDLTSDKRYCSDESHKSVVDCIAAARHRQEPISGTIRCLLFGVRNAALSLRRVMRIDDPTAPLNMSAQRASAMHLWAELSKVFNGCADYFVTHAEPAWVVEVLEVYADFGDSIESRNASLVLEAMEAQKTAAITVARQRRLEQALAVGGPVQFLYASLAGHLTEPR